MNDEQVTPASYFRPVGRVRPRPEDADTLEGKIKFHGGDDSKFGARKV